MRGQARLVVLRRRRRRAVVRLGSARPKTDGRANVGRQRRVAPVHADRRTSANLMASTPTRPTQRVRGTVYKEWRRTHRGPGQVCASGRRLLPGERVPASHAHRHHDHTTYTSSSTGQHVLQPNPAHRRPHAVHPARRRRRVPMALVHGRTDLGCVCKFTPTRPSSRARVSRRRRAVAAVSAAAGRAPPSRRRSRPPGRRRRPTCPSATLSPSCRKIRATATRPRPGRAGFPDTMCTWAEYQAASVSVRQRPTGRLGVRASVRLHGPGQVVVVDQPGLPLRQAEHRPGRDDPQRCLHAAWYVRDHDNAVNDISLYYMWVGASGCGNGSRSTSTTKRTTARRRATAAPSTTRARCRRRRRRRRVAAAAAAAAAAHQPSLCSTATRRRAAKMSRGGALEADARNRMPQLLPRAPPRGRRKRQPNLARRAPLLPQV